MNGKNLLSNCKSIPEILCLRPLEDFVKVGVTPPSKLRIHYKSLTTDINEIKSLKTQCKALILPAVGEKVCSSFFSNTTIKMVQITGAGFDRLDVKELRKKNITVCNMPSQSSEAVAEYCHTSAVIILRQLLSLNGRLTGDYPRIRLNMISEQMHSLKNLTVGIIGYGNIGKATAERFRKSGCKILVFDPILNDSQFTNTRNYDTVKLHDLLVLSDIISIHTPLTDYTSNMIGVDELKLMKSTSILINAARGGIVNEAALADAINDTKIGGAVVDVYTSEPPTSDNPLFKIQKSKIHKILLTPHIAGITSQAWQDLFSKSWSNVLKFVFDKKADFVVN